MPTRDLCQGIDFSRAGPEFTRVVNGLKKNSLPLSRPVPHAVEGLRAAPDVGAERFKTNRYITSKTPGPASWAFDLSFFDRANLTSSVEISLWANCQLLSANCAVLRCRPEIAKSFFDPRVQVVVALHGP